MSSLEDRLTRRCWHLVAHRSELAQPKDFVRLSWSLGDLVLYNDQGSVIAFDNLCPHRGTRFFEGHDGNAPAACPYHGWTFRGGTLRIPRADQFSAAELASARLNTYRTAWCGDFLFAGIAPDQGLDDQLGAFAARLADISADISGRADTNAYDFECHWRVAVENALEADHIDQVHPDTLATLALQPGRFEYAGANSAWFTEVGDARMARRLGGLARHFDLAHAHPGYANLLVFPFAMLSSTFGYSYSLQTFFPGREAGRTHFNSRLLAGRPTGNGAAAAALMESTARLNRQVFEEDHRICRRISPDYDLDAPGRLFGAAEARLRHFNAALAAFRDT